MWVNIYVGKYSPGLGYGFPCTMKLRKRVTRVRIDINRGRDR